MAKAPAKTKATKKRTPKAKAGKLTPHPESPLSPLEVWALSRCCKYPVVLNARDQLEVGAGQSVDLTVRVRGALTVGEDQPENRQKPDALALLCFVLEAADNRELVFGGPREQLVDRLVDAAQRAYLDRNLPAADELTSPQAMQARQLSERLTRQPAGKKKGNVVASLNVQVLKRGA